MLYPKWTMGRNFIIPTMGGWMLGYIDEKIYNGSIIPSILINGVVKFGRDIMLIF